MPAMGGYNKRATKCKALSGRREARRWWTRARAAHRKLLRSVAAFAPWFRRNASGGGRSGGAPAIPHYAERSDGTESAVQMLF